MLIEQTWIQLQSILPKFKLTGTNQATSLCPSHDDKSPSLSLSKTQQSILMKCHAGCTYYEIVNALGMDKSNFSQKFKPNTKSPKEVCRYDYRDEQSKTLCSVVRFQPKQFKRVRSVEGKEIWNWKGIEPPPYRLPELMKAISNEQPVFFVEGEKDADNLTKIGVCATTIAGGAGKWKKHYEVYFEDADLILIPDNDQPGRKGIAKVGLEILSVVKRLRWLELPNLPLKGDASDWIKNEQGTSGKLRQVIEERAFDLDNKKLKHFKNDFLPHTETEEELIERLNQKHFICFSGGKAVVVNEIFNETTKNYELTLSSPADFKYRYENQTIFTQGRVRNVADYWLKHPKRRGYERMIFLPKGEKVIGNSYNLWRGFAFSPNPSNPKNPNDISKFRKFIEHLHYIIASENEEVSEYILDWMSQVVQDPTEKIGTSIVLRSDTQGTGKGTFINIFGELFGKHFLTINSPRHLVGHFNTHLIDNLILFADEAFWAGDKSSEGALKTLITEEDRIIEPKGKDAFQVKNFTRLMIASNKSWVVPTELEDRRFLIVDVSDKRKNDIQYFKMLRDEMNEGGYEALLWFLENREIKTNLRVLPNTEAKIVSKLQAMTPVQKWWHERLTDNYILEENTWEDRCSKQHVYENFSFDHDKQGYISREIFFRELYKLLPHKPKEFQYHRKREIVFPLHEDCCRFFERKFGILINVNYESELV